MEEQPFVTVSEAFLKGMERKVERLKTLMEMSAILSSTLDPDDLISFAMEKAKSDLDAEACSMLFYNKETNRLEFKDEVMITAPSRSSQRHRRLRNKAVRRRSLF